MPNNALIQEEYLVVDTTVILRERKIELTRIVESIDLLSQIKEWQTLKELIFDKMVERLEKNLQAEAKKNELLPAEIYRLQGQIAWAKRYSDLYKLAEAYKQELNSINKKLNENDNL